MLASLQENLIVLAAYSDRYAVIIRNSVELQHYGGPYRIIATRIYDYLDRFKKPPKDHIADLLADKLEDGSREAPLYEDLITAIHEASSTINEEYVFNKLEVFVRRQALRSISVELTNALKRDTEESLDEAEGLIRKANTQTLSVFDPGLRLSDRKKVLDFLDIAGESFPTGIAELDKRGFGPTRKEMWLFIGNTKAGKTWALIHLAKMALSHRLKVCHITLEMSEARCAQRYFQAFFGIAKRKETLPGTKFKRDELERLIGLDDIQISPRITLEDPDAREQLEKLIDKWEFRRLNNVIVKQFPGGTLTVPKLRAYLDNLEQVEQFVPDLLIVDYPDLMKLDKGELRFSLDEVYKDLRGIAVERNIALAIVSQSNREGAKAKRVGGTNVAEAYSKIAHCDCIVTYSQTEAEAKLGLARLHVAGGRNDQDKITIVISQQYGVGAFALDSVLMTQDYWKQLPEGEADE